MWLSSPTVSNSRNHIVVVLIGLVFVSKLALISCANQESQVCYQLRTFFSIFYLGIISAKRERRLHAKNFTNLTFSVIIFRFTRCIWVRGNMMILNLLLTHIMISLDRFLEGNLIIGLFFPKIMNVIFF